MAMLLCTPNALFIADNAVSNYFLILRVVYCQFYKARLAHTKGESPETILHVTSDPWTFVCIASHASSLACLGVAE